MLTRALVLIFAISLSVLLLSGQSNAAPLTTKYFGLTLPGDWVVVNGPTKKDDVVQVLLGQKEHKCSALIIAGPAAPGEGEKAANAHAQRLGGAKPVYRNGQWNFTFVQQGVKGYFVAREDTTAKLLLMLVVSGSNTSMANFVFQMRGPYKGVLPQPPANR